MGAESPPEGAHNHESVLSLIVDESSKKVRKLPSLYFWNTLVHADRDVSNVRYVLERTVDGIARAKEVPTYRFAACRLEGKFGLWGKDFYNRSGFRLKIARRGLEIADDPFVTFHPGTGFQSDDYGQFEPEFAVLANHSEPDLLKTSGAKLAIILGSYRFGLSAPTELAALIDTFKGKFGYASSDPGALSQALKDL